MTYIPFVVLDFVPNVTKENTGCFYLSISLYFFLSLSPVLTIRRDYAGLVAASFFLGQFISCYIWGVFSDLYGNDNGLFNIISISHLRRAQGPFIWLSTLSCVHDIYGVRSVFVVVFDCTVRHGSLEWYDLTPFVTSHCFLGNIGVAKAYVAACTDSSNQARGFRYRSLFSFRPH